MEKNTSKKKILIAYFSHTGNTRELAQQIQNQVDGDLIELKTVKPYSDDYDATADRAKQEHDDKARPKLATNVTNMEDYDVVFLGYPLWYDTMPMALFTFLEQYDFSGKTIIPFATHGGGGFGESTSDIRKAVSKAKIEEGIAINGSEVQSAQDDVYDWLRKIDMLD